MKLEKRGKFAGVKIHLDSEECKKITSSSHGNALCVDIKKLIKQAIQQDPSILDNRTSAEIEAALTKEHTKAQLRLKDFDAYLENIGWEKIT